LALEGGEGSAYCLTQFTPGKELLASTEQEAEWATQPVWTFWKTKNSGPYQK